MWPANGLNRRQACQFLLGGMSGVCSGLSSGGLQTSDKFRMTYILASSLYGKIRLEEIVPEVHKTGAEHIDIWPLGHANQREQMEEMGHDRFAELLARDIEVKLGILTHYDLGPYGLQTEMEVGSASWAPRILICGSDRLSDEDRQVPETAGQGLPGKNEISRRSRCQGRRHHRH